MTIPLPRHPGASFDHDWPYMPYRSDSGMRKLGTDRDPDIDHAMGIARRMSGGRVHVGPITHKADGGRTDTVPLDVPAGAYVLPADIVSALGEGDTQAGFQALEQMFGPSTDGDGGGGRTVPILAAGGEFVISPGAVVKIGDGDMQRGHEVLDEWVKMQRAKHIETLAGLPGPAKD